MMPAIEGCLSRQEDPQRVRVVCFMTDGCVGNDLAACIGNYSGTGYDGRGSAAARAAMVRSGGGSDASEAAVVGALRRLAKQQRSDGRWSFGTSAGASAGNANFGTRNSDVAATSFALLPYLGAGQTHKEGKYKQNMETGLRWLVQQQRTDGDLSGDTADLKMFAHAVATIAVCNAYSMTHDKTLRDAMQRAVDFIVRTQDKSSGGWAAEPGQTPVAWVTVWQIMALRSGYQAFLRIGPETRDKAAAFLEHLLDDAGGCSGKVNSAADSDLALVARLVSRRYLDWEEGGTPAASDGGQLRPVSPAELLARPALQEMLERLSRLGPSNKDAVYNFHVTLLLQNLGDSAWDTWNRQMRGQLVDSQVKSGDEAGSWWQPDDVRAALAGRLLQTALNAMILEVYYRHLPLFQ